MCIFICWHISVDFICITISLPTYFPTCFKSPMSHLSETQKDLHRSPWINALEGGKPSVYWQNIPYFGGIITRYLTCNDHCPLPNTGSCICLNWMGGGTEREVKGEDCQGGGGKVKGQLSLGAVATSVVRQRMRKALQCRVAAHWHWVGAPAPPGSRPWPIEH